MKTMIEMKKKTKKKLEKAFIFILLGNRGTLGTLYDIWIRALGRIASNSIQWCSDVRSHSTLTEEDTVDVNSGAQPDERSRCGAESRH